MAFCLSTWVFVLIHSILGAESLSVQDLVQFALVKEAKELHHFHNTYKKKLHEILSRKVQRNSIEALHRFDYYCHWKISSRIIYFFYARKSWVLLNPFKNYVPKIVVWVGLFILHCSIAEYVWLSTNQKYTIESNSYKV